MSQLRRAKSTAATSSTAVRATSPPSRLGARHRDSPLHTRLARGLAVVYSAPLGGSTSPRLCVRKLTLMTFESSVKIFDTIDMTFESSVKIFDTIDMTFESSIKIFDSVAMTFESVIGTFDSRAKVFDSVTAIFKSAIMTFESTDMVFDSVIKKFNPAVAKKFDLCID
jgi:hypothetical protein